MDEHCPHIKVSTFPSKLLWDHLNVESGCVSYWLSTTQENCWNKVQVIPTVGLDGTNMEQQLGNTCRLGYMSRIHV